MLNPGADIVEKSFSGEIEIIAQSTGNNIVKFHDAWTETDKYGEKIIYIQMELCLCNLKDLLDKLPKIFGRHEEDVINFYEYYLVWNILEKITDAVKFLHERKPKIYHRDLKPLNVLINNEMQVKLCDFGLATQNTLNSITPCVGTEKYMAPEVRNNTKYDEKIDIYSLSVMSLEIFGFKLCVKANENFG